MKYEILTEPSYALAEVELGEGEKIVTEPGAMAWMDDNIEVETKMKGGLWAGLKRKIAGEAFFQNSYICKSGRGKIGLAPGIAGDITVIALDGEILMERGAYMASTGNIEISASWEGFQGMFSEGLIALKARGNGTLFFNAYGDIQEIDVKGGYAVDNGYVVAWEPTLNYAVSTAGRGLKNFLFGDQLITRFSGHGKLWVQSRSTHNLVSFLHPFRRVKPRNNNR